MRTFYAININGEMTREFANDDYKEMSHFQHILINLKNRHAVYQVYRIIHQ